MHTPAKMKRCFIISVIVALCVNQSAVFAQTTTQNILIVELQTGQVGAVGNDFVELYNPNAQEADVTGWRLQYRAASAEPTATWTTKRTFACAQESADDCRVLVPARGRLVVATYDIPGVDEQGFSGGFATTGGQIRLVLPSAQATDSAFQQDLLGYGTSLVSEGQPSPAPEPGKSLKRLLSEDGYFIDTQNNAADFKVGCQAPTPGDYEPNIVPPVDCEELEDPTEPDPPIEPPDPPSEPVYLPLELTELLPDPQAPFKDDTDEFVEIFNPNTVDVAAKNYTLRTGSTFQNKVTIGDIVIPAGGFATITSGESTLSLSNAGTALQLIDPAGHVLEEAPTYGTAKAGQSWMKNQDGWHWSSSPTPGALNILTLPPQPPVKAATVKKATSTKKVAAAKTPAPKTPKTSAPKDEAKMPEQIMAKTQPNYWIIAAIAVVAAGYGVYEYRQDIRQFGANAWERLRKK